MKRLILIAMALAVSSTGFAKVNAGKVTRATELAEFTDVTAVSNHYDGAIFGDVGDAGNLAAYGGAGLVDTGIAKTNILVTWSDVDPYVVDPDSLQDQILTNAGAIDAQRTTAFLQVHNSGVPYNDGVKVRDEIFMAGDLIDRGDADAVTVLLSQGLYDGQAPYYTQCPYDITVLGLMHSDDFSTAYMEGSNGLLGVNQYPTILSNVFFTQSGHDLASDFTYERFDIKWMQTANGTTDSTNRFRFKDCLFSGGFYETITAGFIDWFDFINCDFTGGGVMSQGSALANQAGNTYSNCYFGETVWSDSHGTNLPLTQYRDIWSDSTNYMFTGAKASRSGAPFAVDIKDAFIIGENIFQYQGSTGGEAYSYAICENVTFTNNVSVWGLESDKSIFINCTNVPIATIAFGGAFTNCTDTTGTAIPDQ